MLQVHKYVQHRRELQGKALIGLCRTSLVVCVMYWYLVREHGNVKCPTLTSPNEYTVHIHTYTRRHTDPRDPRETPIGIDAYGTYNVVIKLDKKQKKKKRKRGSYDLTASAPK